MKTPGSLPETLAERFDGLYRSDGERLWRAVFAFARDREIANDAVAEAFAQCFRRGDAVHEPRAWLWRAAFAIARGQLAECRRTLALRDVVDPDAPEPEVGRIVDALAQLSDRQRAVVLLRHYAGYRSREVAALLGMAPATVRVHLARARRSLERALEERDDEDRT